MKAALHGVVRSWREPGERLWRYSRAGVITTDLTRLEDSTRALTGRMDRERSGPLMAAIYACNTRWGLGAVVPVRAGVADRRAWSTMFEMRTPRYTTQLDELPVVVA